MLWTLASTVIFTETQMTTCAVLVGTLVTGTDMLFCLLSRHLLDIERFGWAEHFHSTRQGPRPLQNSLVRAETCPTVVGFTDHMGTGTGARALQHF